MDHPALAGKGVGLDVQIIIFVCLIRTPISAEKAPRENPCRCLIAPDAGPDLDEGVHNVQVSRTNV